MLLIFIYDFTMFWFFFYYFTAIILAIKNLKTMFHYYVYWAYRTYYFYFKNIIFNYKNAAKDDLLEKSNPDGEGDFVTSTHLTQKIQEDS